MKILVTGPQGSGKSTQAILLAQDLGVPYIQLGEIFRTIAMIEDSQTADKVRQSLKKGELVSADLAANILKKRLNQVDCSEGFVLDGYPRNFDDINNFDQELDYVIYLKVSEDEGVRRLLARGRADDTPDLIKQRLKIYYQQTTPLVKYFQRKGILLEFNGEKTVAAIHDDIIQKLKINDIH